MDWNVMSQMKNGFHKSLLDILTNNEKFLKFYSSAHIDDIYSSYSTSIENDRNINSDIEFITFITRDFCVYNDGETIKAEIYPSSEMLKNKSRPEQLLTDADIEEINYNEELLKKFNSSKEDLLNRTLAEAFRETYKDPVSAAQMQKFYPGLEDDLTLGGLLKAAREQFRRLNEGEEYKEWRQLLQNGIGINRDRLFDSNTPFADIEEIYKKIGHLPYQSKMEHLPEWYADIINAYITLDIHGYQEDEINTSKGRKQTFKNTTNDVFHTAFASTCHFYITDDKKNYKKTKAVYENLGINTQVFKPNEFVEFYNNYLSLNYIDHLFIFLKIINSDSFAFAEDGQSTVKSFYFELLLFDYFNRAHISFDKTTDESLIFLSSTPPTNGH
jgi:hypothetical protein